jgi:acetyltransferase
MDRYFSQMSIRNLEFLFKPRSIAVIGASTRSKRAGGVLMRNLLGGGFQGPIMPVNPKHDAVSGVLTYPDVAALPRTPDLAVICTPPAAVPEQVRLLGERGAKAAVIISPSSDELLTRSLAEAKKTGLRLLGPNTLGVLVPKSGLNASFAHVGALPGNIAFVSQSGALCTQVLDWAHPKRIGFSHFISLGDGIDIDFGDVLDYLGTDPGTRAILLYIENVRERRAFMAAARAAARNKPVLAVKAGRRTLRDETEAGRSGALAEHDDVWDAALRRAGVLRVGHIDELFGAVETLARARPMRGDKLAVVYNGGGTGVMAEDDLAEGGFELPQLSEAMVKKLNALLPADWSHKNPVDIVVDAPASRYADAIKALVEDKEIDAVLALHAPTALSSGLECAEAVIATVKKHGGNVLTCWVGDEAAQPARRLFQNAGLPTYETPAAAVRAFRHMATHRINREILMQTPPESPTVFRPDRLAARQVIEKALAQDHGVLTEPEAKAVLTAYGVPVAPVCIVTSPKEAGEAAERLGFPAAVTIVSPDVTRKWDVGGVALNLETGPAVEAAALGMIARVGERKPNARIEGFTVQRMVSRHNARQLIISVTTDPLFGPVILFGEGGRAVEVIRDHAVALPPLNVALAHDLISRTRMSRLLDAYLDRPAADREAIALTLLQVSQILVDNPEIIEIDINPLFADNKGVMCVDAHMKVRPFKGRKDSHLAIHPYPQQLEEESRLKDGRKILLRPIRPEDEPAHYVLMERMSEDDIRMRFFSQMQTLPHSEMARLTQIDYDREMAFIATLFNEEGQAETLGVVRTVADPDNEKAEFAVAIRSDMKGQGLGRMLMEKVLAYHRVKQTKVIHGTILAENRAMLKLAEKLGFAPGPSDSPETVEVKLSLA